MGDPATIEKQSLTYKNNRLNIIDDTLYTPYWPKRFARSDVSTTERLPV
jgi:hypothetical protein